MCFVVGGLMQIHSYRIFSVMLSLGKNSVRILRVSKSHWPPDKLGCTHIYIKCARKQTDIHTDRQTDSADCCQTSKMSAVVKHAPLIREKGSDNACLIQHQKTTTRKEIKQNKTISL